MNISLQHDLYEALRLCGINGADISHFSSSVSKALQGKPVDGVDGSTRDEIFRIAVQHGVRESDYEQFRFLMVSVFERHEKDVTDLYKSADTLVPELDETSKALLLWVGIAAAAAAGAAVLYVIKNYP